jgi:hypothetical protein
MYDTWEQFAEGWKRIYIEAYNRSVIALRRAALGVLGAGVIAPAASLASIAFGVVGGLLAWPRWGWSIGAGAGSLAIMLGTLTWIHWRMRAPRWGEGGSIRTCMSCSGPRWPPRDWSGRRSPAWTSRFVWRPVTDLTFSGGVAYTDARVDRFNAPPGAAVIPAGTPLAFAPKWKGSLGADYRWRTNGPVDFTFGLQASTQSSQLSLFDASAAVRALGTIGGIVFCPPGGG